MLNNFSKKVFRKNKIRIIFTLVLSLITSISMTFAGYSLSWFYNIFELPRQQQLNELMKIIFLEIILWTIAILFFHIHSKYNRKTLSLIRESTRDLIIRGISHLDYETFNSKNTGNYVNWVTQDVNDLMDRYFQPLFSLFDNLFSLVTSFGSLFILGPWISLSAIILMIMTLTIPRLTQDKVIKQSEIYTKESDNFMDSISNLIGGFSTLWSHNKTEALIKESNKLSDRFENTILNYQYASLDNRSLSMVISSFAQLTLIAIALWSSLNFSTARGAALAVGNLAGTFFNSSMSIVQNGVTLKSSLTIFEKFKIKNSQNGTIDKRNINKIEVQDVIFNYPQTVQKFYYNNYTFIYPKNYAIIGASGSGKSTLAKLLTGHYTTYKGHLLIDGIELKDISKKKLLKNIIYIDQEPYLFNTSIRNNVSLWNETVTDNEIMEVLNDVHMGELFQTLPEGLDTSISTSQVELSGGQKQRIILARALILKPKFILIDETTSQLDSGTATLINEMLMNNQKISIILISHHLKKFELEKMDKIYRI